MSKFLVILVLAVAFGLACAIIAKKKGKDAVLWFALGVVFNFIALFALLKSSDIAKAIKKNGG